MLHQAASLHQSQNLLFSFLKDSIASLTCFVFLEIGFPKVECDKKATFGSKPNNLETLTHDFETAISLSELGKS